MLLTITSTTPPATDLGYLLHKNPAKVQAFTLPYGQAQVFYPEATVDRCTAALMLELDPVGLVRGSGSEVWQYVNDRPYAASSFLSVALSTVFRTAMAGQCKERPELAEAALPLEAVIAAVPCRGGKDLLQRLFEPLGYQVQAQGRPLDERFPEWGDSDVFTVTLRGRVRLQDLLTHVYVLVPVLDDEKHYWVGGDEVEKLLRHGDTWLPAHPERQEIARRYLRRRRDLVDQAIARLSDESALPLSGEDEAAADSKEPVMERGIRLHDQRLATVLAALRACGARRVLDLGCGTGKLLALLLRDQTFTDIAGMDVSHRALEVAKERLHWDEMPPMQRRRLTLIHGSLTYWDRRLVGYDAAAVVEVIEHLDPPRLVAFERVLFECAHPRTVVLTTPNVEYNALFPTLPPGGLRHRDHRFEWTREQFQTWAEAVAARFGYVVRFLPIGPEHPELGAPSQMAVFDTT